MKSAVKSQLTTGKAPLAMYFNDISRGLSESQLRFRVIHFWEAKNIANGTLIGIELLLIDEHGTVMQGFISSSRAPTYLPHLKAGATYTLQNFLAATSKEIYRVADQNLTISFSNGSVLAPLDDIPVSVSFPTDRFRFHTHEDFQAHRGLRGDLYDVVGHLRLVNGQSLIDRPVLDEAEVISTRRILVHLQSKDEPVMKLYLWDQAAKDFYKKFTSSEDTPTVLLVTTVNPKVIAGNLALSSMASSRVFIDKDIQPTIDYFSWLGSNPEIAKRVNADEVTRSETMTIGQIYAYIKQENAKEASFDCIATIDDVKRDSAWYYIGCSGCQTKATRGPSSLMCAKCGKTNVSGVAKYLAKISVYDKNDQAVFVLLGDAGSELTGKNAAELVNNYFEANQDLGAGHQMPVPQALIDTIGQTHKFRVKVSKLNLTGKIQAITVTKIVSSEVLPPVPTPTEIPHDVEDEVALPSAIVIDGSGFKADDADGSTSSMDESRKAKRPKHGK
ncbi:BnaA04g07310D [Brassica napus]|uniref:BnaA04g07310D protein n=1 Tax=Brassica napus TaxID=3708 RepID=A0A078HQV0_BRANA|nr:BnaA04g07310D [Brassica napus]